MEETSYGAKQRSMTVKYELQMPQKFVSNSML